MLGPDPIIRWLTSLGVAPFPAEIAAYAIIALLLILLSWVIDLIARRFLLRGLHYVVARSKTTWDDSLMQHQVFKKLAHFAPAIVIYHLAPIAFAAEGTMMLIVRNGVLIFMLVFGIVVINAFLNAAHDIYERYDIARKVPIKAFLQVVKLITFIIIGVFIVSLFLNKSPLVFFSGLGAMTAVLMLIFKDAILGFVAGIQLTANNMVTPGDWIEMPKYGADGDVLELTLTTVKVRNWDKTITTIPTYALISDAFKNWRGMQEFGGRRIKRSFYIDMNTIHFCDEEMLQRFLKIQYIRDYVEKKKKELQEYNETAKVDLSSLANGRRMTNIGTFRAYVVSYLRNHPMVNPEMTFLVRQLAPTPHGLPIEIYVFCRDVRWANYEAVQADIFDHILSVVPAFDLRVFQEPTGTDFKSLSSMSRA